MSIPKGVRKNAPKFINLIDFNNIIHDALLLGKDNEAVAQTVGCSSTTVAECVKVFTLLKDGNIDDLLHIIRRNTGSPTAKTVKLAAMSLGIDVPDEVAQALASRKTVRNTKKSVAEAAEPVQVIETPKNTTVEHNEQVFFCRLLEELHKHNELMEQLMDVVIPKYVADLKDNLNVNFDAVTQSLKRAEDTLEGIKINTRKRGL